MINYRRLFPVQQFSTLKANGGTGDPTMSSFSDLPAELTTDILAAAIPQHPNPGDILAVNRCFNDIGQFIIYTSLRFKSESQLLKFALKRRFCSHRSRGHHARHHKHHHHHHHKVEGQQVNCNSAVAVSATFPGGLGAACDDSGALDTVVKMTLPHFPRSISIRIPGGQGGGIVFEGIKHVFEFCAEVVGAGVLTLDNLEFCLNSHTSDPAPWRIAEALSLVKYAPLSRAFGTCKLTVTWCLCDFIRQSTQLYMDRTGPPASLFYSGSSLIRRCFYTPAT